MEYVINKRLPEDFDTKKVYGIIYRITCNTNDKCYIGQTIGMRRRLSYYRRLKCQKQPKIYNALVKYGVEDFTFEVLDCAQNETVLDFLEDFYINTLDTIKNGYNIQKGGKNGKCSAEDRIKMSQANKGRVAWNKGLKYWTPEMKEKQRLAVTGVNNGRFGKPTEPETRKKQSERKKGKPSPRKGMKFRVDCYI